MLIILRRRIDESNCITNPNTKTRDIHDQVNTEKMMTLLKVIQFRCSSRKSSNHRGILVLISLGWTLTRGRPSKCASYFKESLVRKSHDHSKNTRVQTIVSAVKKVKNISRIPVPQDGADCGNTSHSIQQNPKAAANMTSVSTRNGLLMGIGNLSLPWKNHMEKIVL